jgi:hypothetical protein
MTTGYSGTPLWKKLGIKPSFVVAAINEPSNYPDLIAPLPEGAVITRGNGEGADIVHLFTNERDALCARLASLRHAIKPEASIWVSWYKKAAKLPTEINEDIIRDAALPLGFVDVKVCAVDDKWSGLKLVIRKEHR